MSTEQEIDYQRQAPELHERIEPTPEEKFREYLEAPRQDRNPMHRFLSHIHEARPRTILEIGCGAGQFTTRMAKAGYHVTGLELSPELVEATKQRAELDGVTELVEAREADIETFSPGDRQYDLVAAKLVLHHVNIEKAVRMMTDALKPDGVAVIWEPVAFSPSLQFLRDLTPIKKEVSPNERQLNRSDLEFIKSRFKEHREDLFYCVGRIHRFLPNGTNAATLDSIERFDAQLLKCFPFLNHFAGTAVLACRGPLKGD